MAGQKAHSSYEGVTSHIESMADENALPKISLDDLKDETRVDPDNPQVYSRSRLEKSIHIRFQSDQSHRTGHSWRNTLPT